MNAGNVRWWRPWLRVVLAGIGGIGGRKRIPARRTSLWTNSYFVCTVGGAPLAVIKQYVENQKKV